jgi:hypothetical protein
MTTGLRPGPGPECRKIAILVLRRPQLLTCRDSNTDRRSAQVGEFREHPKREKREGGVPEKGTIRVYETPSLFVAWALCGSPATPKVCAPPAFGLAVARRVPVVPATRDGAARASDLLGAVTDRG